MDIEIEFREEYTHHTVSYPVTNTTWILIQIPCHLDLFVFHAKIQHGFWRRSSHGIFMAFAKKMMEFPSDLVSFSNQTKLPSKRHEEIPVTFFAGLLQFM